MQELIGKKVEVRSQDIIYKGILFEIGETELFLLSETGWIVLPIDRVADVRAAD